MSDIKVGGPRGPHVALGGKAILCCLHHVEKRRVTDLVYDTVREQGDECPCCENLFATDIGDPIELCHDCRPRSTAA